jgi:hypothetical protein
MNMHQQGGENRLLRQKCVKCRVDKEPPLVASNQNLDHKRGRDD